MVFDHPPAVILSFDRESFYAGQIGFGQKGSHLQPFLIPPHGDRPLGVFITGIAFDPNFHSAQRH